LFALAAEDGTVADEHPTIAMVRGSARGAKDVRGLDRLAADFADRRPGVFRFGAADRNDRHSFVHSRAHAGVKGIVNDQGLLDGPFEEAGVESEVAIDLDEQALGID